MFYLIKTSEKEKGQYEFIINSVCLVKIRSPWSITLMILFADDLIGWSRWQFTDWISQIIFRHRVWYFRMIIIIQFIIRSNILINCCNFSKRNNSRSYLSRRNNSKSCIICLSDKILLCRSCKWRNLMNEKEVQSSVFKFYDWSFCCPTD